MRNAITRVLRALMGTALLATAALAHAAFQIEEIYSNADGTVQYAVLHEVSGANGLQALSSLTLVSAHAGAAGIKTYRFTNDLPSSQTADKRVLIGTRGFAALGLIIPDYVIPDQFIATDGGVLGLSNAAAPLVFINNFAYASLVTDGDNATFVNPTNVVTISSNMATNFAGVTAKVPVLPVTNVEFYNPALDHYFMSALQPDIDALDTQRIPGWRRTGFSFKVFGAQARDGSLSPVCRFYIPPEHGNSHFFSASPAECAEVLQKTATDPNFSGYIYETPNAFYIALPDTITGACPAGTIPVYRLWNHRLDSNHRYTTDLAIKAQMIAAGSVAEGYGPDAVDMCAVNPAVATIQVRVTSTSPFAPGCDGVPPLGILYTNAEVEPMLSINPRNPSNIVGVWQQDRWSNGGAEGLVTGASFDGGQTWAFSMPAFSHCTGGNAANGGDYPRSSDPWVSFGPDGTAYQVAIAFSGESQAPGSTSAVLASRSTDGGRTWGAPSVLISDVNGFFNDKESITADPTDAALVYAIWDRLTPDDRGPAMLARSTDGGLSWQTPSVVFDPGVHQQTLNNQIVVLPDGTVVDFFTELDFSGGKAAVVTLQVVRSADKGMSWSPPYTISPVQSVGTFDPATGVPVRDGSTLGSIAVGPHGELAAAWQDARFSTSGFDGIAFSRSFDGGLTWSMPVGINTVPGVAAFEPTVSYRSDGTVGVSYFDFRSAPATVSSLPTNYWLTHSGDGIVWRESAVTGSFDLATAPDALGLFLGDYQALGSVGEAFLPFYVQTNSGDLVNRTDVFANPSVSAIAGAEEKARVLQPRRTETMVRAQVASPLALTPELAQRVHDNARRVVERRKHNTGP